MATPGQFVEQSMVSGFEEARAHKQAISDRNKDAQWNSKHDELHDNIVNLKQRLTVADKTSPEYKQTEDALTKATQDYSNFLDPIKNPGALKKAFSRIRGIKPEKPPTGGPALYPSQVKEQAKRLQQAQGQVKAFEASAPLSPDEQARVEANAESAKKQAELDNAKVQFKSIYPDATDAEAASYASTLLPGNSQIGNWERLDGTLNGQSYPLSYDKKKAVYKLPDGTFSSTVPENWKSTPKATGDDVVKATVLRYGPNYTAEQLEAETRLMAEEKARGTATSTKTSSSPSGDTTTNTTRTPIFTPLPNSTSAPSTGVGGEMSPTPASSPTSKEKTTQPPVSSKPVTGRVNKQPKGAQQSTTESAPSTSSTGGGATGVDNVIDAVGRYEIPIEKAVAARGGSRQKFLEKVLEKYPNYDATMFPARSEARRSFTAGGKDATNLKSLETAVGHLQELLNSASELGNGSFIDINSLKNKMAIHAGNPAPTNFDFNASAVSGEMATVFKNTSGTDQEIQAWRDGMNYNMSPQSILGGVEKMVDLMSTRMLMEANLYRNTFGDLKGFPLLDPSTVQILTTLGGDGAKEILAVNEEAKQGGTSSGDQYIYAKDPQGKVHKAKAGTSLPQGWTLTNAPAK